MHTGRSSTRSEPLLAVLWTAFIALLLIWLVGMVTLKTVSMFFHLLLVVAAVLLVFRLLRDGGRSSPK